MMTTIRCPVCETPFNPETTDAMPFCSRRCRKIDLGRWLGERYALPERHGSDDDEEDASQSPWGEPDGSHMDPFDDPDGRF